MDNLDQSNSKPARPTGMGAAPRRDTDAIALGPEPTPSALWMSILSAVLVLFAGLCLYFARGAVVPALEEVIPSVRFPTPEESEGEGVGSNEEPSLAEVEPVQELNLVCSLQDIETAVLPLLKAAEDLLAAGQTEINRFKGMSRQGGSAQALRNQWARWGGVWRNRVALIRTAQPPRSACMELESVAPICDTVDSVLYLLEQVPSARKVSEAAATFTQAQEVFDEFRHLQVEAAERAQLKEDMGEENEAALKVALRPFR